MLEHTIALIKPDAFKRGHVGHIITRIESMHFTIRHLHLWTRWSRERAYAFYAHQHAGQPYFEPLVEFMSSGRVLALLLAREDAIATWRAAIGPSNPATRVPGEIRYHLGPPPGTPQMENLVHGSDSREAFEAECRALSWHAALWS